jgi:hypothetical protein
MHQYYLICFFIKIESNIEKLSTKMISVKSSTNPKSFSEFRYGYQAA